MHEGLLVLGIPMWGRVHDEDRSALIVGDVFNRYNTRLFGDSLELIENSLEAYVHPSGGS